MRVLITAATFDGVGGVQVYVRDFAAWLLAHGHSPMVYARGLGIAAAQLRKLTIPVTDDLATFTDPPDVIHGNGAVETVSALLHFPLAPGLFTCHGTRGAEASPPAFSRLLRYVAVDDACADRVRQEGLVPEEKLTVLLNAVDTTRYRKRRELLPPRPKRALAFGNNAHEVSFLPVVREACARFGIELDVISHSSGTAVEHPETVLGDYDLVFAKAKCALEAMASGAAVILCDVPGMGGMVRSSDVERLRRINFGIRALEHPLDVERLAREIASYDAADATAVSNTIRRTAGSEELHDKILALCADVVAEQQRLPFDRDAEGKEAARFLRHLTGERSERASRLFLVAQAANRIMQAPVVGPLLTRGARWFVGRGR